MAKDSFEAAVELATGEDIEVLRSKPIMELWMRRPDYGTLSGTSPLGERCPSHDEAEEALEYAVR